MEFQSRPLTASDSEAYVARQTDALVEQALAARKNVLLGTVRGSGVTSLLYRVENGIADAIYLNAEFARSAAEVLASIAARLRVRAVETPDIDTFLLHPDPLAAPPALKQMSDALAHADRSPTVLIDGPLPPAIAFELFGRWRDGLHALPIAWIVTAHQDRLAEYLTPPADVFFDVVMTLEPFSREGALEVLVRRDALGLLAVDTRRALVDAFDGTPRHLLQLARPQLDRVHRAPGQAKAHADATSQLSRGARSLLAEIQGRGPVAATDTDLQHRLGVTSRQLRRNFAELRHAELVEEVAGKSGKPGRPPLTFRLSELGQMDLVAL
jgi:hypothetical protein